MSPAKPGGAQKELGRESAPPLSQHKSSLPFKESGVEQSWRCFTRSHVLHEQKWRFDTSWQETIACQARRARFRKIEYSDCHCCLALFYEPALHSVSILGGQALRSEPTGDGAVNDSDKVRLKGQDHDHKGALQLT